MTSFLPPIVFAASVLMLAPCATPSDAEPPIATGGETIGHEAEAEPEDVEPSEPAEPSTPEIPDPSLARAVPPIVPVIDSAMLARLRTIAAASDRQADVFAKMGGSSIESRAFLHCFATERNVELAEFESLRPTIEFFRGGRAERGSPFSRVSLAARVGWSLRQGLAGRPSHALQEVRAIDPRYALAFFGGNDVQGRNERRFAERLEELALQLTTRGVVPILGATTPRGDDPEMDEWARKYNRVTRGLARAWRLPYIDFYEALTGLPGNGLAGDGVHPNVLLDGGRGLPCVFTEHGLEHGQNQRNLRTVEALDGIRRAMETGDAEATTPLHGEGSATSPLRLREIPFGDRAVVTELTRALDGYSCEGAAPAPGAERVYRIRVDEAVPLEFNVYGPVEARIFVLGDTPDPAGCVSAGAEDHQYILTPGVHHVVVEVDEASEGAALMLVVDAPVL